MRLLMERLRTLAVAAPFMGSAIKARDPESVVPRAAAKDKSVLDYLASSNGLVRVGLQTPMRVLMLDLHYQLVVDVLPTAFGEGKVQGANPYACAYAQVAQPASSMFVQQLGESRGQGANPYACAYARLALPASS